MPCDESWIYCYDVETKRQSSQWKHAGSPRPKKAGLSKSTHKLVMIPFFDSTGIIYIYWVPTGQTVNKKFYVEVLKGVQEEIPSKEASTLQIGSVAFPPGQCTSPQLHPCHNMGFYSPDLVPCDFWLFSKLKGCRYETIEEMKEAVTKVIGTLTQVDFPGAFEGHWVFQKLLERYNKCIAAGVDYFHGD